MLLALNADNDSGGIFQGVGGDSIISEKVNNKHIKDICQLNLVNYHHVESKGAQNKIESTSWSKIISFFSSSKHESNHVKSSQASKLR